MRVRVAELQPSLIGGSMAGLGCVDALLYWLGRASRRTISVVLPILQGFDPVLSPTSEYPHSYPLPSNAAMHPRPANSIRTSGPRSGTFSQPCLEILL